MLRLPAVAAWRDAGDGVSSRARDDLGTGTYRTPGRRRGCADALVAATGPGDPRPRGVQAIVPYTPLGTMAWFSGPRSCEFPTRSARAACMSTSARSPRSPRPPVRRSRRSRAVRCAAPRPPPRRAPPSGRAIRQPPSPWPAPRAPSGRSAPTSRAGKARPQSGCLARCERGGQRWRHPSSRCSSCSARKNSTSTNSMISVTSASESAAL